MNILLNTPDIKLLGGVANHYKGLMPFWNECIKYNFIGHRKGIPGYILLPFDLVKFLIKIFFTKIDLIVLNPSLEKNAIRRDALYLKIAKIFNISTLVFFHGWNEKIAKEISSSPNFFLRRYSRSDAIIVLAKKFKREIENWGFKGPIFLSTTKVDDNYLKNFDIRSKIITKNILFLARIEENKGIICALRTQKEINQVHPDSKLFVAGEGTALKAAKDFAKKNSIKNVIFLGQINGSKLIEVFSNTSIYILPTTHGEGMPTSILEAMAFGLVIISRPVGGVIDFFEEGRMGYLLESTESKSYSKVISSLLNDEHQIKEISNYNNDYAQSHFLASVVASNLEMIFLKFKK